jgi:thioredoxin 1
MKKHPLLIILVIEALAGTACTMGPANQDSGNVSTSPNTEVIQSTVLQSPVPVLIHFWAAWSGPSRVLAPTIETIANKYAGRVKVGRVNVDDHPTLADQFGLKGLPTLIVIEHGSEQARIVGATSEEAIGQMLDQQLSSNP